MRIRLAVEPCAARDLVRLYGERGASAILLAAADVEKLDSRWKRKFEAEIDRITEALLDKALLTGRFAFEDVDFEALVMQHSLDTMRSALDHSVDYRPRVPSTARLAEGDAPPKARMPRSFRELRQMWDRFRRAKYIPPRQRALAERIKAAYLKRVQKEWIRWGEAFRSGQTADREEAVRAIRRGAGVVKSRAKMIVETETTYYYNKTRREVFDQSADVTHYLYMAIRDHRTTKWCRTRHGLVYAKDDPLLKSETPPIHWNCRSEILPLMTINPRHREFIEDAARQRKNHRCEPLPKGWTGR